MNNLINQKTVDTSHLTPIEIALGVDENGMTTAKKLYDFLELNPSNYSRWVKTNITENQFAEEGIDYWALVANDERDFNPNPTQDFKLTAHFAKKLSVKGNGEKAEQAREYFTRLEERVKKMTIDRSQLDPGTQLMLQLAENISRQELEQKRQFQEQKRQAAELEQVKENQRTIAEAFSKPAAESFRFWVNRCLSAIAESENYLYIGNAQQRHSAIRTESYERLNWKRPCRLEQRVKRAKGEAAAAGASRTQINAINKLSVIEADRDLKPVYESVIREMLVAYRVNI